MGEVQDRPPYGPPVPTGGRFVCAAVGGRQWYPLPRRDGGGLGEGACHPTHAALAWSE